MRKILCSPSFTFDSAHVRTASELGLKYQNFRSSLIAYRVHRAFNQSRTNAQYNYLVCDLWEQAFPVHVGNFSLSLTREPPTQMLSGYSRRFQRERNWEWVRKIRSRGREWSERNLYIFLQRRRFLPSIWSSLCISVFQTSFFFNGLWETRQFKGSLFTHTYCDVSGLYQARAGHLSKGSFNYHWFSCDIWRPKGARHVWGRTVKCLGLIAGVSFSSISLSLCSLFFALPPSSVPFA